MRVASIHTWRIKPGRYAEVLATAEEARKIHERVGAQVRTWIPLAGGEPNTLIYVLEYSDIEAYGKFSKKLLADSEWQQMMVRLLGPDAAAENVSNAVVSEPIQLG